MTNLYILRHGETEWNLQRRIQGHLDSNLTALGSAQAEALSRAFASIKIHALYCSDLGRAVQSVHPLEKISGQKAILKTCLRESNLGIFQGKTSEEIKINNAEEYDLFKARDLDYVIPEGESLRQRHDRVVTCLEEIADFHRNETVAVMTHGGVLDSLLRFVLNIPLNSPRQFSIYNASINSFVKDEHGWHLLTWGEISHLNGLSVINPKVGA